MLMLLLVARSSPGIDLDDWEEAVEGVPSRERVGDCDMERGEGWKEAARCGL